MILEYKTEDDLSSGKVKQPDHLSEGTIQKDEAKGLDPPLGNGTDTILVRILQRTKTNRI